MICLKGFTENECVCIYVCVCVCICVCVCVSVCVCVCVCVCTHEWSHVHTIDFLKPWSLNVFMRWQCKASCGISSPKQPPPILDSIFFSPCDRAYDVDDISLASKSISLHC